MSTVTCHTDGCGNAGIAIELDLSAHTDMFGNDVPAPSVVICGVCDHPITDVVPPLTAEPATGDDAS